MTNMYPPLLFTFLLLLTLPPISAIESCDSVNNSSVVDYICTTCNSTLYPEICYTSLSRYASAIQTDPARLALFAINLSLSQTRRVTVFITSVTKIANYSSNAIVGSAMDDCISNLSDAVDEIRESLNQMIKIRTNGPASFQLMMSNVETWMSAALTDLETCTDGFTDVPDSDGEIKKVCDRVEAVKKIISNALALINIYASKGSP